MKAVKTLGAFIPYDPFQKGLGAFLPEAYRKFYKEWKQTQPTSVNFIPKEGKWERNEVTNEVYPIQNIDIPIKYPAEYDDQLWGGEGVVQGFQKRDKYARRVPHYWVPQLHRSVVYSEVLNKHISVIVTDRAISLINSNYGFDHYLLKTPACDLKSLLALKFKRKILEELQEQCPSYSSNPKKRDEVYNRYKQYLSAYTPEEVEWYGYSYADACKKIKEIMDSNKRVIPLKTVYRSQLIEKLKEAKIAEAMDSNINISEKQTWIQKMNPFGKKQET